MCSNRSDQCHRRKEDIDRPCREHGILKARIENTHTKQMNDASNNDFYGKMLERFCEDLIVAEIHNYVQNGYPSADIEKYKADLLASGRPEDFHRLPAVIRESWDNLPEELKQRIREEGVDAAEFRMVSETTCGKEVIHPSAKFHAKPIKPTKTEEERELEFKRHLLYINDTGFEVNALGDDEICIEVDSSHMIGPFASLASVCQYLQEGHHLVDIQFIRDKGKSTTH